MIRHRKASRAGYTLMEILAAVAIVGILAAIAIAGYRKYFGAAYTAEARGMLQGMRGAQLVTMSDRLTYENCSTSFGTPANWFPTGGASGQKTDWDPVASPHTEAPCWRRLNIQSSGPVRYGYATVAGAGPGSFPTMPVVTTQPTWPTVATGEPWFVVAASADIDRNSRRSIFWASSFDKEIKSFQPDE